MVVGGLVVGDVLVVGRAEVVDACGDLGVVVEVGVVVPVDDVVVAVGAAVADVAVTVDGSADTVTVLGSAVTVVVDVSVAVTATVTVDTGGEVAVAVSGTAEVTWTERPAVTEKLALAETTVEFADEGSVVTVAVVSVEPAVVGESASGCEVSAPTAGSASATSSGADTSLAGSDIGLVVVTPDRLGSALWSEVCVVGSPENVSALFAHTGGFESALIKSAIPITVVADATAKAARDSCRRGVRM
ncbi:hypothetical protein [Nocardia alba]|uniref:hypothetical protein n=1 Tax=Nocardia alba TaxID=225051 RepID=UPI000A9B3085|nr:hypothetical protein [Nocardia alba]